MTSDHTYSDDDYADALNAERWARFSNSVSSSMERYIKELEDYAALGEWVPDVKNGASHTYNATTRAQHCSHVYAAVYLDGEPL